MTNTILKNFIVLEGPDATGKSTTIKNLKPLLETYYGDDKVVYAADPSPDIEIAKDIRKLLKTKANKMSEQSILLLYLTARVELLKKFIIPQLKDGKIVVCDRFSASTYVYQGMKYTSSYIQKLSEITDTDYRPELEIILMNDEGFRTSNNDSIEDHYKEKREQICSGYRLYKELSEHHVELYDMSMFAKETNTYNISKIIKSNIVM